MPPDSSKRNSQALAPERRGDLSGSLSRRLSSVKPQHHHVVGTWKGLQSGCVSSGWPNPDVPALSKRAYGQQRGSCVQPRSSAARSRNWRGRKTQVLREERWALRQPTFPSWGFFLYCKTAFIRRTPADTDSSLLILNFLPPSPITPVCSTCGPPQISRLNGFCSLPII